MMHGYTKLQCSIDVYTTIVLWYCLYTQVTWQVTHHNSCQLLYTQLSIYIWIYCIKQSTIPSAHAGEGNEGL